jgi:hypothetical protein
MAGNASQPDADPRPGTIKNSRVSATRVRSQATWVGQAPAAPCLEAGDRKKIPDDLTASHCAFYIPDGSSDLPPVWPSADGPVRGSTFEPLHKSVPTAAAKDAALYELLALIDALRDGRARERQAAERELAARLRKSLRA